MGEIADLIIRGILDAETHELVDGYESGYPRTREKQHPNPNNPRRCPICGNKMRTVQGVADHLRDKHGVTQ